MADEVGWFVKSCPAEQWRTPAASETRSTRQVPALNPNQHQTGFTGSALIDVNAQDLNASFHALPKSPRRDVRRGHSLFHL